MAEAVIADAWEPGAWRPYAWTPSPAPSTIGDFDFNVLDFDILDFIKEGIYDPDGSAIAVNYITRPLTKSAATAAQQFTNILLNDAVFYVKSTYVDVVPVVDQTFQDEDAQDYLITFVESRLNKNHHMILGRPI